MRTEKEILATLSKLYGANVVSYEKLGDTGAAIYYRSVTVFRGPMWVFHALRCVAIFFDRVANYVRGIIGRFEYVVDGAPL